MSTEKHGTTDEAFTLSVDLAYTFLAAAGLPVPGTMQGRDIAPLYLEGYRHDWGDEFHAEHPPFRNADFIPASEALVRKDWKYMYWPEAGLEQLFDLKNDPREENELADSPVQSDRLTVMQKRSREPKRAAR